ncbi:MAG TPA: stress protein [Firmicutes bacterium]|jgi:hypothetical protein|nr:stress protein [Bacillota bacterium]
MIVNHVLLKLKDREQDHVKKAQEVLLGLKGKIEVLLDIQVETNIRPSDSSYDLLLITKFASLENMNVYLSHPAHLEVAKYIGSVLDTQASLCYEMNK